MDQEPLAPLTPTRRTELRRKRERGSYDRRLMYEILDEALVAHVGITAEHGPLVLPMTYARIGDVLYLHGAAGNDLLRRLADELAVCVTVTILDGLVLARSAFHHSMNYRCAMLYGAATRVTDADEMRAASVALLEHLASGRSSDVRPPSDAELRSTLMVRMRITEGSVKVRSGGPIEEPEDMGRQVWAGELPLRLTARTPVPDIGVEVSPPTYVSGRFASEASEVADPPSAGDDGPHTQAVAESPLEAR